MCTRAGACPPGTLPAPQAEALGSGAGRAGAARRPVPSHCQRAPLPLSSRHDCTEPEPSVRSVRATPTAAASATAAPTRAPARALPTDSSHHPQERMASPVAPSPVTAVSCAVLWASTVPKRAHQMGPGTTRPTARPAPVSAPQACAATAEGSACDASACAHASATRAAASTRCGRRAQSRARPARTAATAPPAATATAQSAACTRSRGRSVGCAQQRPAPCARSTKRAASAAQNLGERSASPTAHTWEGRSDTSRASSPWKATETAAPSGIWA
mmetsp:Transcript_19508/g.65488  ORF Transcript_19508/g.65488 Transcript_19508/m.65488 type:complete len:274 (-) Transcript_19508:122-943(-)